MLRSVTGIGRVEILALVRSPVALSLLLLVPLIQLLLFGYAIRPNSSQVSIVIAAQDPGDADRAAHELARWPGLDVRADKLKPGQAETMVRDGKAIFGLEMPARRSFFNPSAKGGPLTLYVDGSDPLLVDPAIGRIEAAYWRALASQDVEAAPGPGLQVDRLYNPQGRADWHFLPALVGVTVMISTIMLGALSLARERERGTWEGLLSLPVSRCALLAGKLLPYVVLATLQGGLVLAAGFILFDLPMRGSSWALLAILPFFAAAHLVLGYAMAARSSTQLSALQGAVAFYLPAMLLSGFLYPFAALPGWAQAIGSLFPLTHFIEAARAATLKGTAGSEILASAWPIVTFLAVTGLVAFLAQGRRLDY